MASCAQIDSPVPLAEKKKTNSRLKLRNFFRLTLLSLRKEIAMRGKKK